MTPSAGNKTTAEREAAKTEQEAHMFECWNKSGGPGWELREKVDKLRMWVAGATVLGAIAAIVAPVLLGWWLSSRLPAPSHRAGDESTLIKSAHAETKGTP